MSRKNREICPSCGNVELWRNESQCSNCVEREARNERESQYDVVALNAVETLDEMKQWIKEFLVK